MPQNDAVQLLRAALSSHPELLLNSVKGRFMEIHLGPLYRQLHCFLSTNWCTQNRRECLMAALMGMTSRWQGDGQVFGSLGLLGSPWDLCSCTTFEDGTEKLPKMLPLEIKFWKWPKNISQILKLFKPLISWHSILCKYLVACPFKIMIVVTYLFYITAKDRK